MLLDTGTKTQVGLGGDSLQVICLFILQISTERITRPVVKRSTSKARVQIPAPPLTRYQVRQEM